MSLNTVPRTFVTGEVETAAIFNAELRDPFTGIQSAWTAYTPTWTGATGNPALGNGTLACAFTRVGKNVAFRIQITMGSTTTYGTGQWRITLPAVAPVNIRWPFVANFFDTSAALDVTGIATWSNSLSALELWVPGITAGGYNRAMTSAVPFGPATGDILTILGEYEAA